MLCFYPTGQGAGLRYYTGWLSVVIKWPIGVCPTTFEEVQQAAVAQEDTQEDAPLGYTVHQRQYPYLRLERGMPQVGS